MSSLRGSTFNQETDHNVPDGAAQHPQQSFFLFVSVFVKFAVCQLVTRCGECLSVLTLLSGQAARQCDSSPLCVVVVRRVHLLTEKPKPKLDLNAFVLAIVNAERRYE